MGEGVIGHVVLQITRLVSNVKYPATITLSRTEILTPNTLTIACIQSYDDHAYHITVTNRLDSYDSLDQPSCVYDAKSHDQWKASRLIGILSINYTEA